MPTRVLMPDMMDATTDGRLIDWLKHVGDPVQEGEPICEVQINGEKQTISSTAEGQIIKLLVAKGERLLSGTVLAWVGETGEDWEENTRPVMTEEIRTPTPHYRGFISPAVARLLQRYPVDLSLVPGSGEGERVTRRDLLAYLKEKKGLSISEEELDLNGSSQDEGIHAEVNTTGEIEETGAPEQPYCASLFREVNLQRVDAYRQSNMENDLHLTYSAFFVKAAIEALKSFPAVQVTWTPEGVFQHDEISIGFLVFLGNNKPVIPVFRGLENLSLAGLARILRALAERTRAGSLQPSSPKAGIFTIANHGAQGSHIAFPGLQPLQNMVLAIGAVHRKPVEVHDTSIEIQPVVFLSLTYDRRVINACLAERFFSKLVECLETWGE